MVPGADLNLRWWGPPDRGQVAAAPRLQNEATNQIAIRLKAVRGAWVSPVAMRSLCRNTAGCIVGKRGGEERPPIRKYRYLLYKGEPLYATAWGLTLLAVSAIGYPTLPAAVGSGRVMEPPRRDGEAR